MNENRARKGEGYLDTCVSILVFLMVLVFTLNVFQFISLKQHMEEMSNQLIEVATYTGGFGAEFQELAHSLETQYGYTVETGAERYFQESQGQVQLGDTMTVQVTATSSLRGLGAVGNIPITATVRKSGISEKYWK